MRQTIIYHAKKHLSLASVLLLISLGLLLVLSISIMLRPIAVMGSKTATLHPDEVPTNNFDVTYPVFGIQAADNAMKKFADTKTAEFVQKLGHEKYNPQNTLTLRYTVLYRDEKIASIVFTEQEQRRGAPMIVSHRTITLDLASGKELGLGSLFNDEQRAEEAIGMLFYDYFKQHHASELTQLQLVSLLQFRIADAREFWLQGDAVVLRLDPKHLKDGKEVQSIAIKRDLLKDSMAYQDQGGHDAVENPVADYSIVEQPKPGDAIDPNQKMLALTFDDGPGGYTNRVLDVLRRHRSHATFFVIGRQVPGQADVVRRTINEGNEVGNHSWDHASLPALTHSQLVQEVNDTQNAVRNATGGYSPVQLRPPYGALSGSVADFLRSQNLKVAMWNVDTQDWLYRDQQVIYDGIMNSAGDGRVILLHDIHPTSVEAAERAIPDLVSQGYQLVTLSQLERFR